MNYQTNMIYSSMWYTRPVQNKTNFWEAIHSITIAICVTGPTSSSVLMLSVYYSFDGLPNLSKTLVLSAMSSLTATNDQVASPHLTPVVNLLRSVWTPRVSLQHTSVLQAHCGEHSDTEFSSSRDTNLQYTYWQHCHLSNMLVTVTLKCSVLLWALSHCSVQYLWSLYLWIVQCSLYSLSLCSVKWFL
jgi:hypothetical protein